MQKVKTKKKQIKLLRLAQDGVAFQFMLHKSTGAI